MKHLILLFSSLVFLSHLYGQSPTLNICSFNIRYDNPKDGEHNWKHRKDKVANLIQYYEADVIGMQEVLKSQLDDLEQFLPEYQWVGVGRDDGKEAGEYSPVFFRKDKFKLLEQATFWLSETCDQAGTMGWDAVCNRVVTWVKLQEQTSNQVFYLFNTHFDHRGETARLESARLLNRKIKKITGDTPSLITGDFNCSTESAPYQVLTENLKDALTISQTPHYGQLCTYNGFKVPTEDCGRRIDFVFIKGAVEVLKHAILTDSWGGKFPSDHFPVLAKVQLNN